MRTVRIAVIAMLGALALMPTLAVAEQGIGQVNTISPTEAIALIKDGKVDFGQLIDRGGAGEVVLYQGNGPRYVAPIETATMRADVVKAATDTQFKLADVDARVRRELLRE